MLYLIHSSSQEYFLSLSNMMNAGRQ